MTPTDGRLRVGLLGVDTSHASAFAAVLSGPLADEATLRWVWQGGTRSDQPDAAQLADTFGIPTVATSPVEQLEATDLVLVLDDGGHGATHAALATPYLEAGIATFIDKPMSTSLADAIDLFAAARRSGAPLLSASALRHARELAAAEAEIAAIGPISSIVSTGPGDWFYYGVHAVEQALTAIGPGVAAVRRIAMPTRDVAVLEYRDGGPTVLVQTLRDATPGFCLDLFAAAGRLRIEVKDSAAYYDRQVRAAVAMARDRVAPIDPNETLEIMRILHAGERSAAGDGERVELDRPAPAGDPIPRQEVLR